MHSVDIEGPCGGGNSPLDVRRTDKWVETVYGEGAMCFSCHVQISSKYDHLLPEVMKTDVDGLEGFWGDKYKSTSRMACSIKLEKKHDGMVVLVPDAPIAWNVM